MTLSLAISIVLSVSAADDATGSKPDETTRHEQLLSALEPEVTLYDAKRHEIFAKLTDTKITASFAETSAREFFVWLGGALGVPLIGRYSDDRLGYGIDPHQPITIDATDLAAIDVLEEVLAQCTDEYAECTWQIRRGFLEVGTKERLNAPAAREARTYYIGDLIIDVPSFGGGDEGRNRRELLALELVQTIVETIEPDAWDYGQPLDDESEPEESTPDLREGAPG